MESEYIICKECGKAFIPPKRRIICKECGKAFIPSKRRNQLYCSHNCQVVHNNRIYNARRAERSKPNHICERCGKAFYSKRVTARYCSRECYREPKRKERSAWRQLTAIAQMRREEKRRKQERDAYLARRDLEAKESERAVPVRVSIGENGLRIESRGNCAGGNASHTRHTP